MGVTSKKTDVTKAVYVYIRVSANADAKWL